MPKKKAIKITKEVCEFASKLADALAKLLDSIREEDEKEERQETTENKDQ